MSLSVLILSDLSKFLILDGASTYVCVLQKDQIFIKCLCFKQRAACSCPPPKLCHCLQSKCRCLTLPAKLLIFLIRFYQPSWRHHCVVILSVTCLNEYFDSCSKSSDSLYCGLVLALDFEFSLDVVLPFNVISMGIITNDILNKCTFSAIFKVNNHLIFQLLRATSFNRIDYFSSKIIIGFLIEHQPWNLSL